MRLPRGASPRMKSLSRYSAVDRLSVEPPTRGDSSHRRRLRR